MKDKLDWKYIGTYEGCDCYGAKSESELVFSCCGMGHIFDTSRTDGYTSLIDLIHSNIDDMQDNSRI